MNRLRSIWQRLGLGNLAAIGARTENRVGDAFHEGNVTQKVLHRCRTRHNLEYRPPRHDLFQLFIALEDGSNNSKASKPYGTVHAAERPDIHGSDVVG